MIEVLIAERNPILRCGFQSALEGMAGCRIVAHASSPRQLLWCLEAIGHDVLLIEAGFRDQVGAALDDHATGVPGQGVIVHSHHHNPMHGIAALRNGVHGYLSNRCSPLELREAIAQVAIGKRYIDGALADELASYLAVSPNALPYLLFSACELRIHKMLALGLALSGIAAQLNLSVAAVDAHRTRMLEKMESDGIAELIRQARARAQPVHVGKAETVCLTGE